MKMFAAFVIFCVLIGSGIYYVSMLPSAVENTGLEEVDQNNPRAFVALISYTEEGYFPTTTTIKKGEKVRFMNTAVNQSSWPAAAVHPTHALYPEKNTTDCLGSSFDACREVKPGEYWEFTFYEKGTWRFHDHIRASKTGTVVVQ